MMYIAILTHDIEYATRLISYIRYEKKHIPYSFQLFTNVDQFLFNAQRVNCQMVIIDEALLEAFKQSKAVDLRLPMLVVTESNMSLEEESIFKFRPASIVYSEIQKRLDQRHQHRTLSSKAEVIVVSSFLAGVGKTTSSLAIAEECSRKGKSVFYFNLEKWTSEDIYSSVTLEHAEEANLSKLYYMMQTNRQGCIAWLQQHRFILPQSSCYTVYPFIHQEDRLQLQDEEAVALLNLIKESGLFDTIIVDLESGFDPIQMAIISESDYLLICTQSSIRMQKKHVQELEHLNKQLDKPIFSKLEHAIYLTQSSDTSALMNHSHPNTVFVPYIEETVAIGQSPLYRSAIQHVVKRLSRQSELAV